jgi:hypothetical protein
MPERLAEVEAALDRMVAAARAHLAAVQAASAAGPGSPRPGGPSDDEAVWHAYLALNNAAHDYDEALNDAYGETTPWDLEAIRDDGDGLSHPSLITVASHGADDPHPRVVSVRQRRDYRVPSVTALLRVAEAGRPAPADGERYRPLRTVGEAVIELLEAGDGSLGMLDLSELEPLDGVVLVAEVEEPLAPDMLESVAGADDDRPFRLGVADHVLARLHESAIVDTGTGSEPV